MINALNVSNLKLDLCMIKDRQLLDVNCIYKSVCRQFDDYVITTGIILIISTIIIRWLSYWFYLKGYKYINYDKGSTIGKWIGNLDDESTRLYWYTFIESKVIIAFTIYVFVIVYFSII